MIKSVILNNFVLTTRIRMSAKGEEGAVGDPNQSPYKVSYPLLSYVKKVNLGESRMVDLAYPIHCKSPGPAKRLLELETSEVKLIDVNHITDQVYLDVLFLDRRSNILYHHFFKAMASFYSDPDAVPLTIPLNELKPGQIVAGRVETSIRGDKDGTKIDDVRRIKITNIKQGNKHGFGMKVIGVDVDDLSRRRVNQAYRLIDDFYKHPCQVCRIKILNVDDIYSKEIFECFLKNQKDAGHILAEIVCEVLQQFSSKIISIVELKYEMAEGQGKFLTGMLNTGVPFPKKRKEKIKQPKKHLAKSFKPVINWYMIEAFCTYFTLNEMKIGESYFNYKVVNFKKDGIISLSSNSSLFHPIDEMINTEILHQFASSVTPEYRQTMIDSIINYEFPTVLAFDNDKKRIHRVKAYTLDAEDETKFDGFMLDRAKVVEINVENLVCPLIKNPMVNFLLPILPPQAQVFNLSNAKLMTEEQRQNLLGKKVDFKIVGKCQYNHHLLEVELLNKAD